ncbi:MAG: hypothetical protein ACYCV7_14810, partial [Acidimicrobiales bacterium]
MTTGSFGGATEAIGVLRERLASVSRRQRPLDWAILSYRVGLATAELPTGSTGDNLRNALAHYEDAASVLTITRAPVEHARVLNAAGAAHRALGDPKRAERLFEEAANLIDGRGLDLEAGGTWSNLGLARTEAGDMAAALLAFDRALALLDASTPEGRRSRIAAFHNRSQARAASGGGDDLEAALADLD